MGFRVRMPPPRLHLRVDQVLAVEDLLAAAGVACEADTGAQSSPILPKTMAARCGGADVVGIFPSSGSSWPWDSTRS